MFCASLRRRPSFAPAVPKLIADIRFSLRESILTTHDLTIPVNTTVDPQTGAKHTTRYLRLLLFSPSAVDNANLPTTLLRIKHFALLTGGHDIAIMFFLATPPPPPIPGFLNSHQIQDLTKTPTATATEELPRAGILAHTKLQAEIANHPDLPAINVLPLATLNGLPDLLHRYVSSMVGGRLPQDACKPSTGFDLLQLCTVNPPMAAQTAYVLSDLFPDLRTLAEACARAPASSDSVVGEGSLPSEGMVGLGLSLQTNFDGMADMGSSSQTSFDGGGFGGLGEKAKGKRRLEELEAIVGEQEAGDVLGFWQEEWTLE